MWRKYAPEFEQTLVVNSLSRLILQLSKGELQSKAHKTKDGKPFWSSRKKQSDAYGLLYKIRMKTATRSLSTAEVHKRHPIFKQYSLADFGKYDKNMMALTEKHRVQLNEQVRKWELQRAVTVKKDTTEKGKKFWSSSQAKMLLLEDTRSGKTTTMKPKELFKTRPEYQDFSLHDFRKHIYQTKYKELAGPYWQRKRNIIAMKEHIKNVRRMYEEFIGSNYEENLIAITDRFGKLSSLS